MNDQTLNVLHANESFYEALNNSDYQSMELLWSNESDVVVIHPGWPPLHGREAVLDSWERILNGDSTRNMFCNNAKSYVMGRVAFVICSECFPEGELVATNIFILEGGEWKIVHHQGGPMQSVIVDTPAERIH